MTSHFLRVHLMEAMFDWADRHHDGQLNIGHAIQELAELQRALIKDLENPAQLGAIQFIRDIVTGDGAIGATHH